MTTVVETEIEMDEGFEPVSQKMLDRFGRYCATMRENAKNEKDAERMLSFFEVAMNIAAELSARRSLDDVVMAAIECPTNPKDLN